MRPPPPSRAPAPSGPGAPTHRGSPARRAARTRRTNLGRRLSRILEKGAREDGAVAMSPTLFVQAMLPHREVYELDDHGHPVEIPDGDGGSLRLLAREYSATNGEFSLSVRAGMKKGPNPLHPRVSRGIPHGGLARLLLAFIVTEARTRDTATIPLGHTVSAFCERVDITPSGGPNGRLRYVLDQLQRLATCVVTFEWDTLSPGRRDLRGDHLLVVDDYHFWSRGATPTATPSGGGAITLSDRFWNEIVSSCFPLDFRKAQLFRGRPTAYDLYLWLTYRLAAMQRTGRPQIVVGYDDLHAQLGSHYQSDETGALTPRGKKDFGYEVRRALRAIRAVWPGLAYETPRGRVVVHSTGPDVEVRAARDARR